jgi:hypothetical protein
MLSALASSVCLAPGCKRPVAANVAGKLPAGVNLKKTVSASNMLCSGHASHTRDLAQQKNFLSSELRNRI